MPPAVVEAVQEKCDEWTQVSNEVVCVGKVLTCVRACKKCPLLLWRLSKKSVMNGHR